MTALPFGSPNQHLSIVSPNMVTQRIQAKDTFVVNVVTSWCPDCTERQVQFIYDFAQKMQEHNVDVLQLNVQDARGLFLSDAHEAITQSFGGHGYPRTVLIKNGVVVDSDNVEVISQDDLNLLAEKFIQAC